MVADGQKSALGLEQKALPQQHGLRSDTVGHMGQVPAVARGLLGRLRRHGQINLQIPLPLAPCL